MQGSLEEVQRSVATIKAKLIVEIRLLLLEAKTSTAAPRVDLAGNRAPATTLAQISFGSLQEVSGVAAVPNLLTLEPLSTKASIVATSTTSSPYLAQGSTSKPPSSNSKRLSFREVQHHEVILGLNSTVTTAFVNVTKEVADPIGISRSKVIRSTVPYTEVNASKSLGALAGRAVCNLILEQGYSPVSFESDYLRYAINP
ncbi:hypothetical protein ACLB2K_004155 [Fragaria x ananassa]